MKPFAWIKEEEQEEEEEDNEEKIKEQHVYFQSTPEFDLYIEQMNLRNKKKGRLYRVMTQPKEKLSSTRIYPYRLSKAFGNRRNVKLSS